MKPGIPKILENHPSCRADAVKFVGVGWDTQHILGHPTWNTQAGLEQPTWIVSAPLEASALRPVITDFR